MFIYWLKINFNYAFDSPERWQLLFQDAVTRIMDNITNLHHDLFFFITAICIFVLYMLLRIVYAFRVTNTQTARTLTLQHHTVMEVVWTLVPAIISAFIVLPSYILIYNMDELMDPKITLEIFYCLNRIWNPQRVALFFWSLIGILWLFLVIDCIYFTVNNNHEGSVVPYNNSNNSDANSHPVIVYGGPMGGPSGSGNNRNNKNDNKKDENKKHSYFLYIMVGVGIACLMYTIYKGYWFQSGPLPWAGNEKRSITFAQYLGRTYPLPDMYYNLELFKFSRRVITENWLPFLDYSNRLVLNKAAGYIMPGLNAQEMGLLQKIVDQATVLGYVRPDLKNVPCRGHILPGCDLFIKWLITGYLQTDNEYGPVILKVLNGMKEDCANHQLNLRAGNVRTKYVPIFNDN